MNAIGKSSVVFVTLSGLFWGGWVLGAQTPEGQQAIARAYAAYNEQQAVANEDLFNTTALRAVVCGTGAANADAAEQKPCLAVVAAGRLFVVDAGSGAAAALTDRSIPVNKLEAVLLTNAGLQNIADLDELYGASTRNRQSQLLPVYGPSETQRMVDGLNQAANFDGAQRGLQAWGPSPEPGRPVIVFEADGLVVSAFTTEADAFSGHVGYRFDYRGRSLVVGGDGQIINAPSANNADVVLQTTHGVPQSADNSAGLVVLTGADNEVAGQMQVSEAKAAGYHDVVAGRVGMLLELPLANNDINVRRL
jgi:ribonuclease Z